MKKIQIRYFILIFVICLCGFAFTQLNANPEVTAVPPVIYVGESVYVSASSCNVTIITVNGQKFLVSSQGGICPLK